MSGWLAHAHPGTPLAVRGPAGDCVYAAVPDQPLVLAGTGTGLAPLWGVLHDALAAGHTGPIHLFHGARTPAGLYLVEALRALARAHPHVHYVPCVLEGDGDDVVTGALDAVLFARLPALRGHRVFLCGDADLVTRLKRKAYLAGARLPEIHADPFIMAADTAAGPANA